MAKGDRAEAARVQMAAQDKVYALATRTTPAGIFLAAYVGWILHTGGRTFAAVLTTVLAEAGTVTAFALARRYRKQRAAGWTPTGLWRPGLLVEPLVMVAWSLPSLFAAGATDPTIRPTLIAFLTGIAAAITVESAVLPIRHRVQLGALFGPAIVGLLARPEPDGYRLAIPLAVFAAFMVGLGNELYRRFERRMQLEDEKQVLFDELTREHERVEDANRQLADAMQQLGFQTTHDHLTGLLSRSLFIELLTAAIGRDESHGRRCAVLYFDIDGFKMVNDSLGHAAGDDLLTQIAVRLQTELRSDAHLARLGDDEFGVMVEGVTETEAITIANRITARLSTPIDIGGRPITVTVSVGVALSDGTATSGTDLLRDADLAMFRAKDEGRNRVELFDVSMRTVIDRDAQELQEFRRALLSGDIVAWYQPEVDLATELTVECEALARWVHPIRGVMAASQFIDMAYVTGLADEVTAAVAASSLRFLRDSCNELPDGFRLRVNLTPRSVGDANHTKRFLASVRAHGIDPSRLTVEVTEQAVIRDIETATTNLKTLRDAGIKISLDDFGTGYSSLALLRRLPFDSIKMDRSFVGGMPSNPADLAIVRTTIDLAHQLDMEVVAEGVENQEQASMLLSLGCTRAQGYLFAPALSPDDFVARVRRERHFDLGAAGAA